MEWGDGATYYKENAMENAPWYEILEPAEAVQYLADGRESARALGEEEKSEAKKLTAGVLELPDMLC
jgi:hypothetical protein